MDFKQNRLAQIHKERREKQQRIKKEFVDTGGADKMIDELKRKREDRISPSELPF